MNSTTISNIASSAIFILYVIAAIFAYRTFNIIQRRAYYRRMYIYLTSVIGLLILIIAVTGFLKLR